ncbi:hypothetical protein ACFX1R_008354 [Malus domestica]
MGYLALGYVYSGVLTVKTDVYSFGVVVLEMERAADSRLMGKFDTVEMERMRMIVLACVHPNLVKRPMVKEAARILKGKTTPPLLPSRKPKVSILLVFRDEFGEISFFCGVRPSLELDDVQYLTLKSHFGKD